MGVIEIVLIILGVVVFIGSFLLPAGKETQGQKISEQLNEETIREMVGKELEKAKVRIGDIVDETITYAIEKTERSMDRLTNEKMMAVNEYSDTVLEEINKNHKEVIFLYDMLNDKHENIKSTVSEVDKKVSEVKQTVKDAEILAKEVENSAEEAVTAVRTAPVERTMVPVASESVAAEPEFKPMEAKKIDIIYKAVSAEKPEKTSGTAELEETDQITGMGAVKLPESVNVAADIIENSVPTTIEDTTADAVVGAAEVKEAHAPINVPAGDTAGTVDVEVTLDAAGRAGNRNSNERILELHKMGKSNMAIAKELKLGIGEVKLVIDLFEGQ